MIQKVLGRMKKKPWLWLVVFILIVPFLWADLQAELSPSSASLCGPHPHDLTLTATNILNAGETNLSNVSATLIIIPDDDGLFLTTEPTILLDDIPITNSSFLDPSWSVQCNPDFPGEYTLYVDYVADDYTSSSLGQTESTITVFSGDTTPPAVQSHLPNGKVITPYVSLEINTNEEATCKYSTTSNVAYDNMNSLFALTGGTSHRETVSGLTDNRYHYYVKCEDLQGNKATEDYEIRFDVDVPPTAQVRLDQPSPVGAGTIKITLTTSEEVKPLPFLSYSFNNAERINVPLTGSGTTWSGYLILQRADNNKVASFEFSGIDLTGNVGDIITAGNIFLVDTLPPEAPTMFTAVGRRSGSVRLSWRQNDEIDYYNIYRSSGEGDFYLYETTTRSFFIDNSVFPGETYYYSVSAVDQAGNEGDLSEDVFITISESFSNPPVPPTSTETLLLETEEPLDLTDLDAAMVSVDELLDNLETARSDFRENDEEEITLLGVQRILSDKKVELLKLKGELGDLKSGDLNEVVIARDLNEITGRIKIIKGEIPREIQHGKELTFDLNLLQSDISAVLNEFLEAENVDISESEKEKYFSEIEEVQENIKITAEAKQFTLTYLDGTEKKLVFVSKEVVAEQEKLFNVILVENIPKSVANDVGDLVFTEGFQVIKDDPILKLKLGELETKKFSYIVDNDVSADSIKETTTLILPDFKNFAEDESSNLITGLLTLTLPEEITFYDVGIAGGILLIVVLVLYSLIYRRRKARPDGKAKSFIELIRETTNKIFSRETITGITLEEHFPYPDYAAQKRRKESLKKLEDITLPSLIEKVDRYLNKMNYDRAVKFYYLLNAHYESIPSKKRGKTTKKQIKRLQKKMHLLMKINLLRSCLKQKDYTNLRYILNDVAKLYNQLLKRANVQEKKFLECIKVHHDTYTEALRLKK